MGQMVMSALAVDLVRPSRRLFPCEHRIYPLIAILAAFVFLWRSAIAIPVYTHTIDEPYHLASAVAIYEAHSHVLGVQHGPLPRLVAGLPLYLAGLRVPLNGPPGQVRGEAATYQFGARVLFDSNLPYWKILKIARSAMLLFPFICLLYVYLLGRFLANGLAAMLATVFFSFDPTLLGHAFWVGTDVAGCAGFVAALYHGLRWLGKPTSGAAIIAGAGAGAGDFLQIFVRGGGAGAGGSCAL